MSNGKFSVFTLTCVSTALNQTVFRIHKRYIINYHMIHPTFFVPNEVLNLIPNLTFLCYSLITSVMTCGLVLKTLITWSLNSTLISYSIVYIVS